jgi:hypothetical protein
VNVTVVCAPEATVTVAMPAARFLLTSDPAGSEVTPVSATPAGTVSVITALPAEAVTGAPHVPPGPAPAGTVIGVPATLKEKLVPTTTPAAATLQT